MSNSIIESAATRFDGMIFLNYLETEPPPVNDIKETPQVFLCPREIFKLL